MKKIFAFLSAALLVTALGCGGAQKAADNPCGAGNPCGDTAGDDMGGDDMGGETGGSDDSGDIMTGGGPGVTPGS